ncbi:MAG: hypothetical protein P4M14_01010, partial [Gammaproteobacteria bacterium]|nr:hypothetical protein [Gammaproteobacteria bacterium]
FMPKGAENSPSTRWQYRYGLLVSCLKDWQEQQKDNQDPVIQGYVSHVKQVLSPHHEEDYEMLAWMDHEEIHFNKKYSELYQAAIAECILVNSNEHKVYAVRKAEIEDKLAQAEANYHSGLSRFNALLRTLEAAELRERNNVFLKDIILSGRVLHQQFNADPAAALSHLTVSEILLLQNKMLENLIQAVQPNLGQEERNRYINESQEAAIKITALFDDRIKALDFNRFPAEKFWGGVLALVGVVIITLAIAALIASGSGSFLGIAFATTELVMGKAMASGAAIGCLMGGIYGIFGGFAVLFGGIATYFSEEKNHRQEWVEALKSQTTQFDAALVSSTKNAKSYGRFFKVPDNQIEGAAGAATHEQPENQAGEGQVQSDAPAAIPASLKQAEEEAPLNCQPGLAHRR